MQQQKQLEATQDFKDKQGVEHKKGEKITCTDQEAQEYIRRGQCKEAGEQTQYQGQEQKQEK